MAQSAEEESTMFRFPAMMFLAISVFLPAAAVAQIKVTKQKESVVKEQIEAYKQLGSTTVNLPGIFLPGEELGAAVGRNLCALTGGCSTTTSRPVRLEFENGRLKVEPAAPTVVDLKEVAEKEATQREKLKQEEQKLNVVCAVVVTAVSGVVGGAIGGGTGAYIHATDDSVDAQRPMTGLGAGLGLGVGMIVTLATNACRGL